MLSPSILFSFALFSSDLVASFPFRSLPSFHLLVLYFRLIYPISLAFLPYLPSERQHGAVVHAQAASAVSALRDFHVCATDGERARGTSQLLDVTLWKVAQRCRWRWCMVHRVVFVLEELEAAGAAG